MIVRKVWVLGETEETVNGLGVGGRLAGLGSIRAQLHTGYVVFIDDSDSGDGGEGWGPTMMVMVMIMVILRW